VFAFQDTQAEAGHQVDVAFTDRHGGTSGGPFASLNLAEPGSAAGGATDEEREAVRRNVDLVVRTFTGVAPEAPTPPVVRMRQVHGADVHAVRASDATEPPTGDALVSTEPGVVLMVRVADCVPVLLADPDNDVVAAVHAGRPGLVAGVVPAAVDRMRALGAERVVAWLGPHVCGACYEVPEQMADEVAAVVPAARSETSWGTPSVDVGAGVRSQLVAAGVEVAADVGRCTIEDEDLFSYRRQGPRSGRLAGLVWVRP